jgi:hypothetical protein
MSQSISQIRSEIEVTKAQISQTVDALENRFDEMKDWHTVVYRHPIASIAAVAGLGLFFSGALTAIAYPVARLAKPHISQLLTGLVLGVAAKQAKNRFGFEPHRAGQEILP